MGLDVGNKMSIKMFLKFFTEASKMVKDVFLHTK